MTNEKRAELLVQKYGFDFDEISKGEIRNLIEQEIECFQEGSSEYIQYELYLLTKMESKKK